MNEWEKTTLPPIDDPNAEQIGEDAQVLKTDDVGDLIMAAWGLIANAGEGNWDNETEEWNAAACRWRDEMFHPWLDSLPIPSPDA